MEATDGPWNKAFLNVIEQACELAILKTFGGVSDEKTRQALELGFSAGVEWCLSAQFDADVARAALALGVSPDEAATGAVREQDNGATGKP
jgi:hypothetical protein